MLDILYCLSKLKNKKLSTGMQVFHFILYISNY